MKQLLIELEDDLASKLEAVASSRSRRRSEFIRSAIRKAIWQLEEQATASAYERVPDAAAEAYVDPRVWEARAGRARKRRKR